MAACSTLATIAVAACGSDSSSGGGSDGSGSATLKVGYIGTAGKLTGPEGFAYSKGLLQKWLAAGGIGKLELSQFANGPLLTAAMTGGSLDVGLLGDTPALLAKSHGLGVKVINQDQVGLPAWVVAKKGGPTSLEALAGKTVGRPQGSYMDRYLQGILARRGLSSKVRLTAMLPPQAIAAVQRGAIDAVALPAWQVAPATAAGGQVIARSETTPDIEGTGVTVATEKVLGSHAGLAKGWNAARLKAVAYARTHEAEFYAYEAKAQAIPGGAKAAESFLPLSVYPDANYTRAGLKRLQGTLNFLVSEKEATPFSIAGWRQAGT